MKTIKSKLLLLVGTIIIVCSVILFHRTYILVTSYIENLTKQQLSLALNLDLAIREYVAETIRPMMFDLIGEGKFIPETMSTSYVARSIFEKVRNNFPDYIIKFASDNPRNSLNKAGPEELDKIKYFNENSDNSIWTGEVVMGGSKYLATFSAMRMEKTCLRCHGHPSDAPIELINRYGPNASFYRPLGQVVGMDTIAIPAETVKKLLSKEIFQSIGFLGLVILILIASLVFIFKFVITDRLSAISNHFLRVRKESEKLKVRLLDIKGNDEIATLARSFDELASKLNKKYVEIKLEVERRKQIQKELVESQNKYKKLFNLESDALAVIDIESGKILDANQRFIDLYGYSKKEIQGMKNTDFSAEPEKTTRATQDKLNHVPLRYHKKKNGEVFPVEITANVIDIKGKDVHLVAIRDITERKTIEEQIQASLKEKEILLSEIHHRVKNNFEIISSLLDMSSLGIENQEVKNLLLGSRARIHSMAMIHSQLYQSKYFVRIDMYKHIQELTENLGSLYQSEKKINIIIEPCEVYLSLKQAIPCALILNELVTNSLKYAFVNKEQGKIQISIQNASDNTLLLRVKDNGGGISRGVGVKHTGSLGLELVNQIVVGQLKGEMRIKNNNGTDVLVEFKRL